MAVEVEQERWQGKAGGKGVHVDVIREAAALEELERSCMQLRCSANKRSDGQQHQHGGCNGASP